jgi:hypothetical protein
MTFLRRTLNRAAARSAMSGSRLLAVHALIGVLVLGSFFDIVTGTEHWPFSPYPMFSRVEREPTLQVFRIIGVTNEAAPREIPIRDYGMLRPLDQCRVATAFARTVNNTRRAPLTHEMLRDRLFHYEQLRVAGEHEGPPLSAIRLYDTFFLLDSEGRNVEHPDRAVLVAEVSMADASSTRHEIAR